jgi:hypothetical protein
MRAIAAAALGALLASGTAWGGVVPNQGNQSMSGAKIKPPSHEQDKQDSEQSAERPEAQKDEKR